MLKYEVNAQTRAEIEKRFTYHPPFGDQPQRYVEIRDHAGALAALICSLTPKSREQALALTNLEQTVMWANAAIARNEKLGEGEETEEAPAETESPEAEPEPDDGPPSEDEGDGDVPAEEPGGAPEPGPAAAAR